MKKFNPQQKYLFVPVEDVLIYNYLTDLNKPSVLTVMSPEYRFMPGILESIRESVLQGYGLVLLVQQPEINSGAVKPMAVKHLIEDIVHNLGLFIANQSNYDSSYTFTTEQLIKSVFIADSYQSQNLQPDVPSVVKWIEDKKINTKDCLFLGNTEFNKVTAKNLKIQFKDLKNFVSDFPDLNKWIKEDLI